MTILDFLPSIMSHIVKIRESDEGSLKKLLSEKRTKIDKLWRENSAKAKALLLVPSKSMLQTGYVGHCSAAIEIPFFARLAIKFLSAKVRFSTAGSTTLEKFMKLSLTFFTSGLTLKIS